MFAYLSKKIQVLDLGDLCCTAWKEGWIAVGGHHDGLLKIIHVNFADLKEIYTSTTTNGDAASNTQTLEGHTGAVTGLAWNESFHKLVSTDENGLTIVWSLQEDIWCQEMMNNRSVSYVSDMKWTDDGELICITYYDGVVIVGSVDGNRVWGLDLNEPLLHCEWLPGNQNVIFVTRNNIIKMYDKIGRHIKDFTVTGDISEVSEVSEMHWRRGHKTAKSPKIVAVSTKGHIMLMNDIKDSQSYIINSFMSNVKCMWTHNGRYFAVCGQLANNDLTMQLYSANGQCMYETIIAHNEKVIYMQWESSGVHLLVSTDKCIYLFMVKGSHRWTTLNDNSVLVYEAIESEMVVFLNIKKNETNYKALGSVSMIKGNDSRCLLVSLSNDMISYSATICDVLGNICFTKQLKISAPQHASMSDSCIAVSDNRNVHVFIFNLDPNFHSSSSFSNGIERMFDIHDASTHPSQINSSYVVKTDIDKPKISSISVSSSLCLIALEDNRVFIYSVPNISRLHSITVQCQVPKLMELNSDSTKISVIDSKHAFHIFDLDERVNMNNRSGIKSCLDPSTVTNSWAMKWSKDDPHLIAVMSKDKLLEVDLKHEDDIIHIILDQCDGYIMGFQNFEFSLILLDEVTMPSCSLSDYYTLDVPSRLSVYARNSITKGGDYDTMVLEQPKNRQKYIWKCIGDHALEKLDFQTAEMAFVLSQHHSELMFIEDVSTIDDEDLKLVEVLKHLGQFKSAGKKCLSMNRIDLAVQMYMISNDLFQLQLMVNEGAVLDEILLSEIFCFIAESYKKKDEFQLAAEYYNKGGNNFLAIDCHLVCNNVKGIEEILNDTKPTSPHLQEFSNRLWSSGNYKLAILCHKKMNIEKAMKMCIDSNLWAEAASLAQEGGLESQLEKFATAKYKTLLHDSDPFAAFTLCQIVGMFTDAATVISNTLGKECENTCIPYTMLKKVSILTANQIERHKEKTIDMTKIVNVRGRGKKVASHIASSIEKLMRDNNDTDSVTNVSREPVKDSWRRAAAYHYFLISQEHIYSNRMESAMHAAIRCCGFKEMLDLKRVYAIVALAAYHTKYFEVCSRALIKFRSLVDVKKLTSIEQMEYSIFSENEPINKMELSKCYTDCLERGKEFNACTITGSSIAGKRALQCKVCQFYMLEVKAHDRISCAMCHHSCKTAEVITVLE